MSILQEATFERLLSKYERKIGEAPPFSVATVDDAIAFMRDRLGIATDWVRTSEDSRLPIPHMYQNAARAPRTGPAA